MTSVNVLVGCLAVMGAVQSNEENGDPPQNIQHLQRQDGAPPQQVRPPQGRKSPQPEKDQILQHEITSRPQRDPFQQVPQQCCGVELFYGDQSEQGFNQWDIQLHQKGLELYQVITQQRKQVSILQRAIHFLLNTTHQPLSPHIERPAERQKLLQNAVESITVPQLGYQIQCLILAALFTSILTETLSKNQQSNQRTTERQTDQRQSRDKQHSQQVHHYIGQLEQQARLPRSIGFADPSHQCVDILKNKASRPERLRQRTVEIQQTQLTQARVAKLLANPQTQLQAAATESATAACKQRLFNTCAGSLRVAALC